MHIKRIELFGFKSFATRTVISFDKGINAILGPNGCGKSNVVDAMKWVLGEQSYKNMRASKMEDVIFNGTDKRKALNVAEVSLVFDNEDGAFPIDMPEISVRRRIHRDGENEYFMNNASCRLRDIRELFFDTGVGKTAYSILEQGKIDQILSNKPEERRLIFEEAAGITKYKIQGQEARRKLEKTQENLTQIYAVYKELHRRFVQLKDQAAKVDRYQGLKDAIFSLEVRLSVIKLLDIRREGEDKKAACEAARLQILDLAAELEALEEQQVASAEGQAGLKAKLADIEKRLYGIDQVRGAAKQEQSLIQERIDELLSERGRTAKSGESLEAEWNKASERQADLKEELAEEEKSLAAVQSERTRAQEDTEKLGLEKETLKSDIKMLERSISHAEAKLSSFSVELQELTTAISQEIDKSLSKAGSGTRPRDLLLEMRDALDRGDVAKARELLARLEELLPSFLDEFYNPEGVFRKKAAYAEDLRFLQDQIVEMKENRKRSGERLEQVQSMLDELVKKAQRLAQEESFWSRGIHEKRVHLGHGEEKLTQLKRRIELIEAQVAELDEKLADRRELLSSAQAEAAGLEEEASVLDKEKENLKAEIAGGEAARMAHASELARLQAKKREHETQMSRYEVQIESLEERETEVLSFFHESHGHRLENFLQDYDASGAPIAGDSSGDAVQTASPRELKSLLRDKQQELKGLGQLNFAARAELEEIQGRHDFMEEQINDLEQAIEDLETLTKSLDDEAISRFMKSFKEIQASFAQLFKRLFGGGKGELTLTDESDVLGSGIDILAQPPGKSLEHISLLSGGERSLTAVALLFATYQVKPSPFCILDEMDAALDEANILRFIQVLVEFSQNSQFIVITHSKKTVTGASTLIGITMEEAGVSNMISLQLQDPEQAAASVEEAGVKTIRMK